MSEKQTEAQRLADEVDEVAKIYPDMAEVSAELRRLDEVNGELLEALKSVMEMNIKGHQLQDRLQFSDAGRAILGKARAAITKAEATE